MTDATPESAISEERLAEIVETLRKRLSRASRNDRAYERPMTWDEADVVLALIDDLRARLAAAEGRAEVRCSGCGSDWTSEDLARERKRAGILSCCPERNAMTIDEWKERATTATARVAELEGALKDGFMTTTSGGGANPYVQITFATIVEMQRCHLALLHIGTARALTGGSNG